MRQTKNTRRIEAFLHSHPTIGDSVYRWFWCTVVATALTGLVLDASTMNAESISGAHEFAIMVLGISLLIYSDDWRIAYHSLCAGTAIALIQLSSAGELLIVCVIMMIAFEGVTRGFSYAASFFNPDATV